MEGLQVAVMIGVLLIVGGALAARTRVPTALVLLVLGIAFGFVPALGEITLPPEVVLLLFLPSLLYWESITTSPREIRRNLRAVVLLAVPLVLATVAVVAVLAAGLGLPVGVAITLGAIVGPTDATAVASVAGRLPRRTSTVLRAESLINDGTALTVYAIAVEAVSDGVDIDLGAGILRFLAAYGGGLAIGLGIAVLAVGVRRIVQGTPVLENTVGVLTPLAAYLPAEELHVSGVLAVVTAGLVITRFAPRLVSARTRSQAWGFWQITTWILNGALFLLIGLQAHTALERLGTDPLRVLGLGLGTAGAVIGVRLAWLAVVPLLIGAVDRRPAQYLRVPLRQRSVIAWAGFRGAVSLAAALALPEDFPRRVDLVTVTLVVILVTLLVQGLTLPGLVRWARLPADPTEVDEQRRADDVAFRAGLAEIPVAADRLRVPDHVRDRVLTEHRDRAERAHADEPAESKSGPASAPGTETALLLAVIAAKREAVVALRDTGEIDDTVLRRSQQRLDIEELRLGDLDNEP